MPITITHKQLLDSTTALQELSDMSIPVRTALKLRKILRTSQTDLDTFNDTFKALSKKHAKKKMVKNAEGVDEEVVVHPKVLVDGKEVDDENRLEIEDKDAFEKDRDAILESPLDIPFDKIKVVDLSDPKDAPLKIKTSLLFSLDWLIED